MANHIRVLTEIIFSYLVVFYFGVKIDVSLTKLLITVGVTALHDMLYHVILARR